MNKQVLFIHSAGDQGLHQGSSDLAAYLQDTLADKYNLLYPKMPEPDNPKYTLWKGQLEKELAALQGEVVFIGHSLGGSVLLKYLSEETCPLSISGLFLIAVPYWDKDFKEYALPDNFVSRLPQISQVFLYHSRNDDIVPFEHLERYAQRFPQAISRALDGDQHTFNDGLPELVDDIKSV